MRISYAITVKDELVQLDRLLNVLYEHKRSKDEIVIVFDSNNGSTHVEEYLRTRSESPTKFRWYPFFFEGNFSELKNYMTLQCTGDFIVNIDADEVPNPSLLKSLPMILEMESNLEIDVFLVPRINLVDGITEQHIKKWGWKINEKGYINFPDYQWRVYRRTPEIRWINKVHERLSGFKNYAALPAEEFYCLKHLKDIKRQERQNSYYETL